MTIFVKFDIRARFVADSKDLRVETTSDGLSFYIRVYGAKLYTVETR
jgi:hypothetical protein